MLRGATQSIASIVARPIATVAEDMLKKGEQYPLGNLIADAQRAAGSADMGVMNNGGIRADLRAGPATYGALFEIQPFANVLVRLTVRGKDLRAYLEANVARAAPRVHLSGVIAQYDLARPAGSRIVSATVAGAPLDDARQYTLVFTDYMSTSGEGATLSGVALKSESLGIVDLDALITYAQSRPGRVIRPDSAPRFSPVPR
jgi:2',3'-cyclic-nucleotide 2'-phosphodiesterase (5'-nucleotidase family)